MNYSSEIEGKIKDCDPEIINFIDAFQTENAQLQKRIVKLEVERISFKNKINALEDDLEKLNQIIFKRDDNTPTLRDIEEEFKSLPESIDK